MRIRTLVAATAATALLAAPGAAQADVAVDPTAAQRAHGSSAPQARAAHTGIVRRTPAPGARASAVKSVAIVFSQQLVTGKLDVYRGDTKLSPASSGPSGARVKATFSRALARGSYTARWRAVASDGHAQSGSWSFSVK